MVLELYVGRKKTRISVQSDPKSPKMYRVHGPSGISDMVNLSRAKDAALSIAGLQGSALEAANWRHAYDGRQGQAQA